MGDLIDLANFFECSIDYLVGRENDFGQIVLTNAPLEECMQIWGLYSNLSKEQKQVILFLLKSLQNNHTL